MKQISKKLLWIGVLLFANILFFNIIKAEIWLSIRSPLLTGFTIALALTIPEIDFSKVTKLMRWKRKINN